MKITLSLKGKWWHMIAIGVKNEEYRELKPYWIKRLLYSREHITEVEFTLGYPKADDLSRRLTFPVEGIRVGIGKPEWGAPNNRVIIIKFFNF